VTPARARAGFTLVELLAVLLILSILGFVLITQLGTAEDSTRASLTRARLQQIQLAIETWESDHGDFPRSAHGDERADAGLDTVNLGAECLVLALWSDGDEGMGLSADELINADGDAARRSLCDLPARDLFELGDLWDNPIAYFHHADYGRVDLYRTYDTATGEPVESRVQAHQNPRTKLYYAHRGFQLLSAGADGVFGTDDDLTSFERR